jgi:hypothetical protein
MNGLHPHKREPRAMTRRRSVAIWALIVLASLLALVSALTVWSKQQLLDTDKFTSSSAKLLANDEIRATLSSRLADQLNQRIDFESQLEEKLPPRAKGAAPAIAAAIENSAGQVINAFLGTSRAQQLWERANRRAHGALVNVLEGKDAGPVSTANGNVVLDLRPLIQGVAERLGVGDRLKQRAPPDSGQIVLLKSNQLDAAQKGVRVLNALSSWLWLAVFALLALAVYLASGKRREMLEAVGFALLSVGVLLLVVRRFVGDAIVDSVVKVESSKPTVHAIWAIETDLLRDLALALVFYGLFALLAGILAGPSRAAVGVRRWLAPTWRERPYLVWLVAGFLFLVFIAWGPSGGSRRFLGVVILAALVAFGLEVWRRQTLREFPEEGEAPAGAAGASKGALTS